MLSTIGDLHAGLADVLREQGDLDAADGHLGRRRSWATGRRCSRTGTAGTSRGPACCVRGAISTAPWRCSTRPSRLSLPGFFPDVRPMPAQRARIHIAQGRLADAGGLGDGIAALRLESAPDYLSEFDRLTLARLLVAPGPTRRPRSST